MLESVVATDLSSSKLFTDGLNEFKGCVSHQSTLKGLKSIVGEVAEELKCPKAFTQRASNVLTLASKASEYNLHTLDGKSNIIKLYFYNIEKAISLLDYLRVNTDDATVNKVKNTLNKVKKVSDKRVYNDEYAKVLKDLFKEHKVELTADGKMIKVEMTAKGVDSFVSELRQAENIDLLAHLLESLESSGITLDKVRELQVKVA